MRSTIKNKYRKKLGIVLEITYTSYIGLQQNKQTLSIMETKSLINACLTLAALCMMLLAGINCSAQWQVYDGMAVSYDSYNKSALGVGTENTIAFNSSTLPILNTAGDYRLVVDGKYVTLTGVGSGGSWVTAPGLDGDVYTAIQMLKNGSHFKLQYCADGHDCMNIISGSLSGSTNAINKVN